MLPDTLKKYCCEDFTKIEGYSEAVESESLYDIHHKLETNPDSYYTKKELIEQNLYYNRPASELMLIEHNEHVRLHVRFRKEHPDLMNNWKNKLSESNSKKSAKEKIIEGMRRYWTPEKRKEKSEWRKNRPLTLEERKKISEANKGKQFSDEHRRKLSEANKGKKNSLECIEKCRQKSIEYWNNPNSKIKAKEWKWFTNGEITLRSKECPEGFWQGRTLRKKEK